jgi:hypothetical protein
MLLDDIKNVLTLAAFRPDEDDPDIPWSMRFEGRKSLLLNVGRNQTSWRSINKKGQLEESGYMDGEFTDIATQCGEEWRGLTENGWVTVSINHRFIISLENNLMRGENCAMLLRTNPRAVLGPKYDRGKRYAVCHHPAATTSMLLAVEESMVKVTEDVLKTVGLKAGRVCCGLFAMLEQSILMVDSALRGGVNASFVLLAACEGSVATLSQHEGQWKDFRCRSGLGADAVDTTLQIVRPMLAKNPPGAPVFLVTEGQDEAFRNRIMEELVKVGAQDLSVADGLWQLLAVN